MDTNNDEEQEYFLTVWQFRMGKSGHDPMHQATYSSKKSPSLYQILMREFKTIGIIVVPDIDDKTHDEQTYVIMSENRRDLNNFAEGIRFLVTLQLDEERFLEEARAYGKEENNATES